MNGAIVLFGITRGQAKKCYPQFQSVVLDRLSQEGITYDKYLHCFELSHIYARRSHEINYKVEDPLDWKLFNPDYYLTEPQEEFDSTFNFPQYTNRYSDCWATDHENTKNLLRQLSSLKKVGSLLKGEYDFYFLSRLDLFYTNNSQLIESIIDVSNHPEDNILYTPRWNPSGGLNDRIAIGNKLTTSTYCNRIDEIMDLMPKRHCLHSETLLFRTSEKHNFTNKSFNCYAARTRADGRLDPN